MKIKSKKKNKKLKFFNEQKFNETKFKETVNGNNCG